MIDMIVENKLYKVGIVEGKDSQNSVAAWVGDVDENLSVVKEGGATAADTAQAEKNNAALVWRLTGFENGL